MTEEFDPAIERATARAKESVTLSLDFDERVMAAVRAERWASRAGWRRLALAAGIGALMLGSGLVGRMTAPRNDSASIAGATAAPNLAGQSVEFVVSAPGASRVTLAGDFNAWSTTATPLRATGEDGVWSVTIPLSAGRHEYAFVVDGERWLPDPTAPRAQGGDYGPPNSVVTVTGQT
jgi:hypothetical protein